MIFKQHRLRLEKIFSTTVPRDHVGERRCRLCLPLQRLLRGSRVPRSISTYQKGNSISFSATVGLETVPIFHGTRASEMLFDVFSAEHASLVITSTVVMRS